ncbi:MAG: GDSL-type esterase/lipase family protein [Clostridiales bacterium]|nr:GDSL-type esterase/lipase family protein [Clostridiales bacterium]
MKGTILCYGDSNTAGFDPRSYTGDRYPEEVRWTGILAKESGWIVRNYGMNGRSIPNGSPVIGRVMNMLDRGAKETGPVWFWVMLGTNDLLQHGWFTAENVASRMEKFLRALKEHPAVCFGRIRLCLIAPPAMRPGAWAEEERLLTESRRLGAQYREVAERLEITFMDAGEWDIPMTFDGVHFSEEGHRKFAENCLSFLASEETTGSNGIVLNPVK